jgi:ABC-type transport system involved in multi-copper enzyme maturation permease subunit
MRMPAVLTVAHLTVHEARRKRILAAALVCGAAFLAVFGAGVFFARGEIADLSPVQRQFSLSMLTVVGLYAAGFLSVLFAVLLPVDALSGDIDSGVMQTLAAKPIRRGDIVIGKWIGHWVIVVAYTVLLCAAIPAITGLAGRTVRLNLHLALPLVLLQVTVMQTLSIAGGTRFNTVTNGVVALGFFGVAFMGGWIEQVGTLAGLEAARTVGIVASLVSPADAMWRLGAHYLQPPLMRGMQIGPLSGMAVPSVLMVWWAVGFTVLALVYAVRTFRRRPL